MIAIYLDSNCPLLYSWAMNILKLKPYILSAFLLLITLSNAAAATERPAEQSPSFEVYSAKFVAQDTNNDKIYDGLTAYLTIKTSCVGSYILNATLEDRAGKLLSASPFFEYTSPIQDPSLNFIAAIGDAPRKIKVTFSGEDIRRAGTSGVYIVKFMNMGQIICDFGISPYKELALPTPPFNHFEFGEQCGSGQSARPCKDVYK